MIGPICDPCRSACCRSPKMEACACLWKGLAAAEPPLGWMMDFRGVEPHDLRCVRCLVGYPWSGSLVPAVVVVRPVRLGDWRKKTLQLAQEGLVVGAFTEVEEAQRWVQSKALTQRCQTVFEQIQ